MAVEIEIKMRLTNPGALEQRLEALEAEHIHEISEINTYFDTPDHTLKSSDQGLRLRIEQSGTSHRAIITHKGPRAHGATKSRAETEVEILDAAAGEGLLRALGYQPVLTFQKQRRSWRLGDCRIELDELPHIGQFIEVEGPSESSVLAMRDRLELTGEPLIQASYIAMLSSYLAEAGSDKRHIMLDEKTPSGDGSPP